MNVQTSLTVHRSPPYRGNGRIERSNGERSNEAPCPCHERPAPRSARGWHARKGPLPVLNALHDLPGYGRPRWVDHPYRLRLEDGRWCYVAEPYSLDEEAIADLDYLAHHGFEVTVSAWRARHYRGHTVAVEIAEEEPWPPLEDADPATIFEDVTT